MPSGQPLAGCRVLVVEDEYLIGDDLDKLLTAAGAIVIGPVARLDQAMDRVIRDGFEVVVLDINLRDEMAFPIADELKRQNVPFIFATGYDQGAIPELFADVKRWEKPFHMRDLVADIAGLCPKIRPA
ncbi:response regulator [Methylobacterium nodulans]|uniref:Response regulator receiver protein n=1 Tax=Methylobacterium nodulans (strain LMG 21967 / CNCM I-2342 / ORS 2060) TaxID=460265 RepID=B8IQM6_METNO|nr:response regulator [Methylobacterium nodulans]ACL60538.1 response regulator receiver protein [Methylobacterium nodulans ORS 2060]